MDEEGSAFLTGQTLSPGFPTTPGAFDRTFGGGAADGFVTKLGPTGSALFYSTFLGGVGSDSDFGTDIAVGGDGSAYVTGGTGSADFPTTPGAFDRTFNGGFDAVVTKVDRTGSALSYSTFLGGSGNDFGDIGREIDVDEDGSAYVTGITDSRDFPTTPGAFDRTIGGELDAFVTKVPTAASPGPQCTITGTPGDDRLEGTSGPDVICGFGGDDHIKGLGGDDVIRAGPGADVAVGGVGDDRVRGGPGPDYVRGDFPNHRPGADVLRGDRGARPPGGDRRSVRQRHRRWGGGNRLLFRRCSRCGDPLSLEISFVARFERIAHGCPKARRVSDGPVP